MSTSENNGKKNNAKVPVPRVVTVFMLLALLIIGLVSTTFASFVPQNADGEDGSLIAQVKSAVVNRSKDDLADTKANVDVADTGANKTYYFGFTSWSLPTRGWFANSSGGKEYKTFTNCNTTVSHDIGYSTGNHTYAVYSISVDSSYTDAYITISNGAETSKITLDTNKITLICEWGGNANFGQIAYSGGGSTESEVYLSGSFNSWSTSADKFTLQSGTTYKITKSLSANSSYTFKIIEDGTWLGNNGTIENDISGWTFDSSGNCTLKTGIAGIYTFTFDSSDNKVSVTYPSGYTYTAVANPTAGGSVTPSSGTATSVQLTATASSGYKFKNWTFTNGSGTTTTATTTFTPSANNAKATANFVKVYTVTYNANGGTGAPAAGSVNDGSNYTVSSTKPTKTGYTFKNWNTKADGTGTSYASGATISSVKANITLYAQYTINTYTIKYDANSGTGAPTGTSVNYGQSYTVSSTKPTKTGYTFKNWNTKADGSGTSYASGATISSVKANITLYAQYTLNTYTITYKDGSTPLEGLTPTTYDYETTVILPTNATKVGYVFVGWHKDSNFADSAVTQIVKNTTTGIQTFYAKWQESNFNLTVVDIEGNSIADKVKVVANGSTTITETSGKYKIPNLSKVEVSVTAPQGYYAKIQDSDGNYLDSNNLTYTTSTGNNPLTTVKFVLDSVTADAQYYVEFCKNPTIKVVQPKYGSIYITSGSSTSTKYYMNGESVYAGTTLTVHTMIDNDKNVVIDGNRKTEFNSCTISSVKYTPEGGSAVSLKNQETNTFKITVNTTVTAEITMNALYAFDEDTEKTEYGKRRIFFTDNADWDKDSKDTVSVHYSDVEEDVDAENFDVTANSVVMTYKYENEANQGVYYADIPFSAKYVVFYNNVKREDNKYVKTKVGTITNDSNAFWNNEGTLEPWHCEYSDFIATDRATTAQQGIVPINNTITFEYSCNYGDDTLSAEVVSGNTANVEFNSGYLNITPTSNTYDYSLVKVTSKSSKTSKYYLVKLSKITAVVNEMQKIFPEINSVGLSGSFSSSSVLTSLQYYVLYNNFPGEEEKDYVQIGDIKIPADKLSCSYDVIAKAGTNGEKYSGVRFFKITAKDSTNAKLDVIQKATFGTNSTTSTGRSVYLLNTTGVSMSKYNVRACFESGEGKSWVTMQQLEGTDYYRANIPDGYEYTVSFYLTHKNRYANIKSNEEGFNYICYFYNEDVRIPNDINVNPVYQIKEFNSDDRTMRLVIKE